MGDIESIVRKLLPVLDEGFYWSEVDEEGNTFLRRREAGPMPETPWIYHNLNFQCVLWHRLFFGLISGESMVHSHCHECYKVVVIPRTFEELLTLDEYQSTLEVPCKSGIELRDFVNRHRIYGGYFYNRGLEEGQERWKEVKAFADEAYEKQETVSGVPYTGTYDGPMKVILKRGCSEFERALGDSSTWEITEEQRILEEWMDADVDYDPFGDAPQPDVFKESVRVAWLKWAHHHGDLTYIKFMPDGKPLNSTPEFYSQPYTTYEEEE